MFTEMRFEISLVAGLVAIAVMWRPDFSVEATAATRHTYKQ